MDDMREALASFVIDSTEKAHEGEASEAVLQAMARVAHTLLWDEHQRLLADADAGESSLDERLVETAL